MAASLLVPFTTYKRPSNNISLSLWEAAFGLSLLLFVTSSAFLAQAGPVRPMGMMVPADLSRAVNAVASGYHGRAVGESEDNRQLSGYLEDPMYIDMTYQVKPV